MYPLVFVHPEENKATMRVAFFGFCALTLLFVGYLFDRQRTFTKLKQHLLAELERNVTLQLQASADLLNSMPDQNHFWDRLSMEFRRALTMEKTRKAPSATPPKPSPSACAPRIPSITWPTISSASCCRKRTR
jgi:hypothetical protein